MDVSVEDRRAIAPQARRWKPRSPPVMAIFAWFRARECGLRNAGCRCAPVSRRAGKIRPAGLII